MSAKVRQNLLDRSMRWDLGFRLGLSLEVQCAVCVLTYLMVGLKFGTGAKHVSQGQWLVSARKGKYALSNMERPPRRARVEAA